VNLRSFFPVKNDALANSVGVTNFVIHAWALTSEISEEKLRGGDFLDYALGNDTLMFDLISPGGFNVDFLKTYWTVSLTSLSSACSGLIHIRRNAVFGRYDRAFSPRAAPARSAPSSRGDQ
jgi:hypothetical protein